jgi:preprotein translocase subunit Sec61beta
MTADPTPPKPADPAAAPTPGDLPYATFAQAAGAVFWSFFGVRKGRDMREDAVKLKPQHVIGVGLASALVLVLALVALVRFITRGL